MIARKTSFLFFVILFDTSTWWQKNDAAIEWQVCMCVCDVCVGLINKFKYQKWKM